MKYNVGDLVKWDGHDARIAVIMQHPSRYIIEYTVRQSDVSGANTHTYNRTKNVKEDELASIDGDEGAIVTDEQRNYNLNRPSHLIAGQVIRDIEALQMVKYGPQHSAPIHRLVEQYQELLFQRDQKIAELMAKSRGFKCRRCDAASLTAPCLVCDGCHSCCTCITGE